MADYVAILKKAVEGVDNATPEVRQKVYEKARLTITRKIEAIDPPPPQAAIDRQMAILETAISDVEAEYALADATGVGAAEPEIDKAEETAEGPALPKAGDSVFAGAAVAADAAASSSPEKDSKPAAAPVAPPRADRLASQAAAKPGGNRMAAIAAGLVVLVAAAFGAYTYRDQISAALGGSDMSPAQTASDSGADEDNAGTDQQAADDGADADTPGGTDDPQAADTAQTDTPPATDDTAEPKLTQRLLPDGSEVDEGPAGGEAGVGEGTSVAALTQQGDQQATEEPAGEQDTAAASDALPVGQKAIFYEERTNNADGSAMPGAVVWSVVQESPGSDLPPEPAIRAEISVPDLDLTLRMTVRRNADTTLPASHIIELVFSTPDDFAGVAIDQVQRVTFKSTEQAPGNPLVALPAKIADGYFLVALNDAASALQTNMTLLRREPWIDIPVTYKTGRRALITMEKGIPGDKVFDEVLKDWEAKAAANNG